MSEVIEPIRELDQEESVLLLDFAKAVSPGLVQYAMVNVRTIQGDVSQLSIPMLSKLTFMAAGFMANEYMKRRKGLIPTDGLNRVIPMRE